jgi:hypothetical protein
VQGDRVPPRVGAEGFGMAGIAAQDAKGGGLAGAVGAEEAVHL